MINKYMNYANIYYRIIENAKLNPRTGYTEVHHIIPKSIGGTDDVDNLVTLSAKEHFVCHRLLTKMFVGKQKSKMVYAAWAMTTLKNEYQKRYKINSRVYAVLREEYAKEVSERSRGKPGKQHTEETKQKMSEIAKNRGSTYTRTPEHNERMSLSMIGKNLGKKRTLEQRVEQSRCQTGRKRKSHSIETREKISNTLKGRKTGPCSDSRKENISKALKGKTRTPEHASNISKALKGRTPTESEQLNFAKSMAIRYTCEHCGKFNLTKGNYRRWHGDNCKNK